MYSEAQWHPSICPDCMGIIYKMDGEIHEKSTCVCGREVDVSEEIAEFTHLDETPKKTREELQDRKKTMDAMIDAVIDGSFPVGYINWSGIENEFRTLLHNIRFNMEGA